MRTLIASLVLVSGLGGCAGKTQDAPPDGDAESHVIRGNAWYRERIKIAPGADFTVQLIDDQLADSPAAVIASSTHEDVAGPPYEFALSYDPAKLRPNGHYSVGANLRGADGNLLFVSERRAPMTPGSNAGVEIMMVRVPGPGEAPPPPARIEHTRWTCDRMTFEANFDIPGERVELMLPEGTLSLPLAQSASGARYADHRGNEFWTKGDTGTLTREGDRKVDCVRADANVPSGSPWDQAKQRGMTFRGVGNEPGWFVEVGPGDAPPLHAELDYGDRKLDVAKLRALSGLLGYAGTAKDGSPVRLVLERKKCSDSMSDETYPVEATLSVGDKTWKGCGRFLTD